MFEGSNASYCGYSVGHTTFRLFTAIVTLFVGIAAMIPTVPNQRWMFFALAVLWPSAMAADCTAIVNAFPACEKWNSEACKSDIYGLTVAIDIVLCFLAVACFMLFGGEDDQEKERHDRQPVPHAPYEPTPAEPQPSHIKHEREYVQAVAIEATPV